MQIMAPTNSSITNLYNHIVTGPSVSPRGQLVYERRRVAAVFDYDEWFIESEGLPLKWDYIKTELKWYLKGDRDDSSICEHASIWKDIIDEHGRLNSNYGYYYNESICRIVRQLVSDPYSRQAVISINRPEHMYPGNKDVPCTMYLCFQLRDRSLDMHVHMRSQDAVFGLRNDLPAFQMFKTRTAFLLGAVPGRVWLAVDNMHVYERHIKKVQAAVKYQAFYFDDTPFNSLNYPDFVEWVYS